MDEFLSGKHRQRRRNVSVADLGSRQSLYLFVLKSEERAYQRIVVYVSFVRDDSLQVSIRCETRSRQPLHEAST